ncbi:hypothetical protein CONLIGDRAFT_2201 [Coniochaeta ligniaria NRRL 30616]|uniref:gamma-glutamylcyclotransferase n=1 Tax=Coniochaeta ligniaria NRRL 30616 TaxID=1408157 RepID=A0A1J7JLV0_9PEZI|nr:hypothetical protein CONLIGDRAFT_2201 [Coniochaeta ligniaria NRRL 30616]
MAAHQPHPDSHRSGAILDRLRTIDAPPPHNPYPPITSIPRTSAVRLTQLDAYPKPFPPSPVPAPTLPATAAPKSVLYLAYGSNLCAKTFLGTRGIRPLSQINVSAPSLRLVFDLPGLPYAEPCFANAAPRKIPKLPDPPKLPPDLPRPPFDPPTPSSVKNEGEHEQRSMPAGGDDPVWSKGMVGVVYEVTPEDFAKIVATEGGGASYADILVPCLPVPPRMGVPEKPDWPGLPKMFVAHTLCAPRMPGVPGKPGEGGEDRDGNGNGDGGDGDDGKWKMPGWMRRLVRRLVVPVRRPDQEYAQPSARYLKLIRDGAREHELPDEYQRYLAELKPYTITRLSQRIGLVLLVLLFGLPFLFAGVGGRVFADESGRVPRWLAVYMTVLLNLIWMVYDNVFKPVFGDGERTEETSGAGKRRRRGSILRRASAVVDEEKRLLEGESD